MKKLNTCCCYRLCGQFCCLQNSYSNSVYPPLLGSSTIYRFYQDQPLKCISQSEHELFNGACKNSSHHFLCPSKWCIWSPLNLLKVTCTLSWFNVMFDITAQLNIDGIDLSWCRYKRSFSFSQWLLSDCCPQRGSCNTLRVEETGKDFRRKLYCVYQLFWQWLMLFVRF